MSSRLKLLWPRRRSIRTLLALWYGGVLSSVLIFFGLLLYVYLSKNLYSDVDRSLRSTAETLARVSLDVRFPLPELDGDFLLERMNDPEFFNKFFEFFDPFGNAGFRSKNLPNKDLPLTRAALDQALRGEMSFETFPTPDQGPIRVLTFPVVRDGRLENVLQVGGSLRHIEKVLGRLRFLLFLILPTALLLALGGGWFLAHQALRPVDVMAQTARQITAGDLSRRIPVDPGGDELARLAETFNAMIGRMEELILGLRQFSADASHELRTPLTILKGETEMTLRQARTVEEYQQTLASSLEEIDRISRIVEDLFLLSKADLGENRFDRKPVRLDHLLVETVAQLEPLGEDKGVVLSLVCESAAEVTGDPYRLREVFMNLVENAVRYTPAGGRIDVALSKEGKEALIRVSDTGIGIPEKDLPRLFDRFYRSDEARAMNPKGSGLGLAIAQRVVVAHGGRIDVASKIGKGTTFTLRFPLLSD
jgi:heavy metal sensor kinase